MRDAYQSYGYKPLSAYGHEDDFKLPNITGSIHASLPNASGSRPLDPARYFISCDHGRTYYVIHVDNRKAWRQWLEDWDGFSPPPEWAKKVSDGLSNVTFERPEGM